MRKYWLLIELLGYSLMASLAAYELTKELEMEASHVNQEDTTPGTDPDIPDQDPAEDVPEDPQSLNDVEE